MQGRSGFVPEDAAKQPDPPDSSRDAEKRPEEREGANGTIFDNTEHKRAEEALRGSEERYRKLFEEAMDGIALADPDTGILLDCNQALAALVGRNRAELIGQPQAILHPPASDNSAFSPTFKLHTTTREGQVLETQVITATGEIREVEIKTSILYLQGRKILQGIFSDITERKHMEDRLRESEHRLRRITENMLDMVVETDLQGVCKYASQPSKAVLGYDPKDLVGKSLYDFIHPEDLGTVTETIQRAVSTGRLWTGGRFECRYRHADGHYVWLENLANIVRDENGQMIGSVIGSRDITERKRLEEELHRYSTQLEGLVAERTGKLMESERRFRELAELLPQIVFETDEAGKVTFGNQAGFAITGYAQEDLDRGFNALQLFAPEERAKARDRIMRTLGGERSSGTEYRLQRKDGSTFPVIIHTVAALREGKTVGLRGIAIDITERKRIEDSLRESAEKYRDLFENANDLVQSVDGDGRFVLVNRKWLETLGYSREELKQLTLMDILRKDQVPHCMELFGRVRNGEALDNVETVFLSKDGREILVEGNVNGQFKDGQFVATRGIFRDVTERKRMEESLRESEERLETIFDSVRTGIMIIDSKTHLIVDANPAATEMAGAPKEQIVGSVCHKYVCPAEKGRCPITDLGQTVDNAERVFLRANGKTIPVMKSVRRIVLGGQEHLLESFIDITEHKKLEAQLAESQRFAAIGETATMIGHDLRNPLQAITSIAYLAKKGLKSSKPEEKREVEGLLESIDEQVLYMDKIVSDLHDYAQSLTPKSTETSLPDLVKTVLSTVKVPTTVKVSVEIPKGFPNVLIDSYLMRRVLTNLVINAIQAMPKGGRLVIRTSKKEETATVSVQDTGTGIPEEDMHKLFNPFFTTKAKGQGLGLAVCKRLVEAQGGKITVESKPGKGTTFTTSIPQRKNVR
jgi:PAS domain S-box-containing protein